MICEKHLCLDGMGNYFSVEDNSRALEYNKFEVKDKSPLNQKISTLLIVLISKIMLVSYGYF